MSNAVSALSGAKSQGFATIEETGLRGMITLRCDLASADIAKAVKAATGAEVPAQRKVAVGESGAVAWMSPDELLVVVAYEQSVALTAQMTEALTGAHSAVTNVSDARAVFRVSGDASRDVLAKLAPVDFASDAFGAGDIRRTRFAQVPAAVWGNADGSFEVICFRSVAQYVFDVLRISAEKGGEVRFY